MIRWRSALITSLVALPVVAIVVAWMFDAGGYDRTAWAPGALGLLGLLVAVVVGLGDRSPSLDRRTIGALGALGAYVAFSYCTILWAESPGEALEGSHRALLYWLAFTIFAVLPWDGRGLSVAVLALVAGVTAVELETLLRAMAAADPTKLTINGRVAAPIGYPNATAAACTIAAAPALVLAARPQTRGILRALLLGACGLLIGMAIMSQSRGWLYTLPVVWLVALVAAPYRGRFIVFSALVSAAVLSVVPDLMQVYDTIGYRGESDVRGPAETATALAAALDVAGSSLLKMAIILGGAGFAVVLLEAHVAVPARLRRLGPSIGRAAALLVIMATAAATLVAVEGDPVRHAGKAWEDFHDSELVDASRGPRFASLATGRYDFWRVGVRAWADRPVLGLGQDNFAQAFLRHRRVTEEPRWVHSLPLRLLVHTGIVGLVMFAVFSVSAIAAVVLRLRGAPSGHRSLVVAALLPFVAWAVQGSVDWLWEFPALSVGAFAFLAAAAAARPVSQISERNASHPPTRRLRAPLTAIAGCGVIIAACALVPFWLAGRHAEAALRIAPYNAAGALDHLERAADLDPLATGPLMARGALALSMREPGVARRSFQAALRRDPGLWLAHFEIGLLDSARRRPRAAARAFERSRMLNPREELVHEALRRLRSRHPLGSSEANARLRDRALERLAR